MPLKSASGGSKAAQNKAVAANMQELSSKGAKQRPQKQKQAIAINAAKGGKKK